MSTKRKHIDRRRQPPITPQMLALFIRAREILHAGADEHWEEEGGRRREYLDTTRDLHSALNRHPWETCICDTIGQDQPPQWMRNDGEARLRDYAGAVELRRELERLADGTAA